MDQFLNWLSSEKKYSPHTITSYKNDLAGYGAFLDAQFDIGSIELSGKSQIKTWIMELLNSGYSPTTVNRKLVALSTFFNYCIKEEIITSNPVEQVSRPKKGKRLAQFIDETTTQQVFSAEQFANDFGGLRSRLIMELLYATGIRVSELIGITHERLDMGRRELKVLGKGNKERYIPVSENLLNLVSRYLSIKKEQGFDFNPDSNLLVTDKGAPLYPMFVSRTVKSVLQQYSNISGSNPHVLRHTFATHLLNNGSDITSIKDLMGHASLASTTVYTHNTIDRLKKVHKDSHPRK